MSIIQRIDEETDLKWTCPDCGTFYFCVDTMRFCPACRAEKDKLDREYWEKKAAGMRSIASEIVKRVLEQNK